MYKKQTLYQQEGKRLVSVYPADLPRLGALLAAKLSMFGFTVGDGHPELMPCRQCAALLRRGRDAIALFR